MAKKGNTVKAHIIPRSGTAADWTLVNPVLLAGELGVETDTGRFKFGNGANPWNELPYSGESGGGLTEIPIATEDTVGGFKSNPRGDVGAVEILGDGTAEVDTVRQAQSANQADRLASSRTIALSGEASGSVAFNGAANATIPVVLNVPIGTQNRVGGIKNGGILNDVGYVAINADGYGHVDAVELAHESIAASYLKSTRTISLDGVISGSRAFNGTSDISIDTTLKKLIFPFVNIPSTYSAYTLPAAGGIYLTHDTITLTLPSNPVAGTMFVMKIVGAHDHGVNIKVGKTGHYINDGKNNKKTTIGFQGGEFQLLFWDGADTWQHSYCPCH